MIRMYVLALPKKGAEDRVTPFAYIFGAFDVG